MPNSFEEINILDNFYQTSSFYPMPVVLVSTISESGQTNLGAYSLCFPYYIAGKSYYSMLLLDRNSSNTAHNILRTRKASINFIPDKRSFMKVTVALGYPGETTEEKMKGSPFELSDGLMQKTHPEQVFPKIVADAFQIFECTWMAELEGADKDRVQESYSGPYHNYNGITSEFGAHFILRVDKILLKSELKHTILHKIKSNLFPPIPIDYGYRDNTNFWLSQFKRPYAEPIPKSKGIHLSTVTYAAARMDPEIKFTDEACKKLVKVPRIFLKTVLQGCVDWAKENNVKVIESIHMDIIRDKRAKDRKK
jgi:flavin reductase (DIM6/NTAB) family NADH-FMN oxidoreductase RutF